MEIVCFGQQNWDYCWTAKQQIMTRLAGRGHRVLYVDPSWSMKSSSSWEAARALVPVATRAGLQELDTNLHLFTYQYAPPLRWQGNQDRWGAVVRGMARELGFRSPLGFALHPDAFPLLEALDPTGRVYYAVDEMSAFGGTPAEEQQRLRGLEERLLATVDVALAVSPRLYDRFSELAPHTYLLENGADFEHFAPENLARARRHPVLEGLPSPCLGFIGQVDERLDQELLVTLARRRRDWQFVLAGRVKPGVSVARLEAEVNIHLLGYQPYSSLPGVLRDVEVCLVPYEQSLLTHSCNPLKVYEYLSTGKPVVSTPLDGLRICRDVVTLASGADAFEAAVEQALRDPDCGRGERLARAASHTWDSRVDQLEGYLEQAAELARKRGARPHCVPSRAVLSPATPPHFAAERLSWKGRLLHDTLTAVGWAYYGARRAARVLSGRTEPVRKILVVRQTRLGDLVAFLPTLAALRRRFPEAKIVLGVQPGMSAGALLERCSDVDEVRELEFLRRPGRWDRLRGACQFFAEGFDLVVSGGGFFVMREAFFSGAPYQIGLDDGHPLQALNGTRVRLDPTRHEAENNLALIEALGGSAEDADRAPRLNLDPERTREGARLLCERLGVPADAAVLTVHPGSQKPSRRWPVERFTEVVNHLLSERPDLHVLFTGVPGEDALIEQIRAALPSALRDRAHSTLGLTDLPTLAGLLRHSAAVLCNDTGVLHVARAAGAPLVALLGPENDRLWGPHPLGEAPATALRHVVPCAPCQRWDCQQLYCLRLLSVDEVLPEVRNLLDGKPTSPSRPGTPQLIQLTRRVRRHTWASLASTGMDVPLVSVLLPSGTQEEIVRALTAIDEQDYPRLEMLVPESAGVGGLPPEFHGTVRSVPVNGTEPWRSLVDTARGAFITVLPPGGSWSPGRIGSDVAALMRDPQAAWIDEGTNTGSAVPAGSIPRAGTFRREALAAALAPTESEPSASELRPTPQRSGATAADRY